jgi:hypothetical protein
MTVGGSIASLGSPEPPPVIFLANHHRAVASAIQETLCRPKSRPLKYLEKLRKLR